MYIYAYRLHGSHANDSTNKMLAMVDVIFCEEKYNADTAVEKDVPFHADKP